MTELWMANCPEPGVRADAVLRASGATVDFDQDWSVWSRVVGGKGMMLSVRDRGVRFAIG
jgi:hypothetical protein